MPALSFDQKISLEMLRMEKLRTRILTAIFLLGLILQLANFLAFYRYILDHPYWKKIFLISFGFNLAAALFEIGHLAYLNRIPRKRKFSLSLWGKIAHTTLEALFPTFLLYFLAISFNNPFNVLDSPTFYGYYILIILSILRLNFTISVWSGFVSAAGFLILVFFVIEEKRAPSGYTLQLPNIFAKSLALLLCGVVAGFIANQVNKSNKRMVQALEDESRVTNLLGQQTSKEVADEILATDNRPESKMMNVCIMFIDIRNFTEMVGKKSAAEIMEYQNTFFSSIIEVVYKNKGIINQFLGDGCMVTFGAPQPSENPCQDAVNAAYQIKEAIEEKIEAGLLPPTTIGIGMHVGDAVTGNIGNEKRQQYSITGSVVILAFRVEKLNKKFGSQILATGNVIDRVSHFASQPEPMGNAILRGWEHPIMIYKLA